MLGNLESQQYWHFSAFGKHPAAKDYFRLGHSSPFVEGLSTWVENGYRMLTGQADSSPDFCSWRFWARGFGKESLVCGVVRLSSDSLGRLYPLLIMGAGPLPEWEEQWELLPFACEKTWCQIEYLATHVYADLKKLEGEIGAIRPPSADWEELAARKRALTGIGSPTDPYASFLDLASLKEQAAGSGGTAERAICLDRGPCNDKILQVSLWHHLFRENGRGIPNVLFMGGTLEKAYMAVYRRALAPGDFIQLWSVSSAGGIWAKSIGMEYAMDLSALGKEPVRPDQPSGSDVRYDPLFDQLQAEVDRISLPSVSGAVDWEKVVRLAAEILSQKSKDLLVASYLAVGLVYTRRIDGLAIGLKVYRDLLEHHGENLFPERQRGRLRSVEWWLEKSETALKRLDDSSIHPEQQALMEENLEKLGQLLGEQLPDAPSLQLIRTFIQHAARQPEEPVVAASPPKPVQDASPAARQSPTLAAEPRPAAAIAPRDCRETIEEGFRRMREAAVLLRDQDLANPLAYRLHRHAAWLSVAELPPATAGRTLLPPPTAQVRSQLAELQRSGDSTALLKTVEGQLGQQIFWLDLNRLAAEALVALGSCQGAVDAVRQETAFFLQRLPGLDELAFADGTPFADAETKGWLKSLLPGGRRGAAAPPMESAAPRPEQDGVIDREINEASSLISEGKLIEAIDRLQERLRSNGSQRERLQWRLALSRVLMDADQTRFALPHLEQVVTDIDSYRLEEYEPAIALEGLKLAWHGFDSQAEPRFKEKAAETLHRIARIDLAEVVRLSKG